jgi:magnesium chelatase subunit I
MGGIHEALRRLEMLESPAMMASALEFILEGLHLNKKLNKKVLEGEISYWG